MVIRTSEYQITAGSGWAGMLNRLLKRIKPSSCFILCDENTFTHCLPQLVSRCPDLASAEIIELEPGEASKNLQIAAYVWQTLLEKKTDRHSLIVNLGGGVVTDLGAFCASVYKRGIRFMNVPTSLLAMADASVGGKNGIDFEGVKNIIGTFSPPAAVFINPEFLRTLPEREFRNGLAEIFKIALVSDEKFWKQLSKHDKMPDSAVMVQKSIALKNKIVRKDPLDHGIRKILNFGHSIGHAIELGLADDKQLLHGEAVVTGMIVEAHIAWQKKLIGKKILNEVTSTLLDKFNGIPFPDLTVEAMVPSLSNDKKSGGGKNYFSLITGIGACDPSVEVSVSQVEKGLNFYNQLIR